ncbi:MAG TPA: hypothetical protein DHW82_13360 [Spirochaetia bacterium]|nr:MAG: hypothetical protein A2Y41_07630 [Spirochaetes bacterium GWB1_36_13]HCL57977.1 hypothetical protein [Spirochaetia bacterium]
MTMIEILGLTAGSLTTIAFLPQLIQTWKSKSAKDISLGMFLLFTGGIILWLIYGIFMKDMPIILANSLTLVLASMILFFKIKYG